MKIGPRGGKGGERRLKFVSQREDLDLFDSLDSLGVEPNQKKIACVSMHRDILYQLTHFPWNNDLKLSAQPEGEIQNWMGLGKS